MFSEIKSEINSEIYSEEIVYLAWISQRLGAGNSVFKKLYHILGSAEEIYNIKDYSEFKLTKTQAEKLEDKNLENVKRALFLGAKQGFYPVSYTDERYPKSLKNLSNPPSVIYCKGIFPDFNSFLSVGIVGTRNASEEAILTTSEIAQKLSKKGVMIISGLALGVDAYSHVGALKTNGFTVGVSGVRAGQIYPKENSFLYENLYKKGLVICEHSPVDLVERSSFPIRNRIVSALSDALIMVEAGQKSGALITAQKSISLNKPVLVPLGNEKQNQGGRALLSQKAILLNDYTDVINTLDKVAETEGKKYFSLSNDVYLYSPETKVRNTPIMETSPFTKADSNSKNVYDKKANSEPPYEPSKTVKEDFTATPSFKATSKNAPEGLSLTEKNVYLYVLEHPDSSTDQIISALKISSSETAMAASMLEIYGYLNHLPGDKWRIV